MFFSSEDKNYYVNFEFVTKEKILKDYHHLNLATLVSNNTQEDLLDFDIDNSRIAIPVINENKTDTDNDVDIYIVIGTDSYIDYNSITNGLRRAQDVIYNYLNITEDEHVIIFYDINQITSLSDSIQEEVVQELINTLFGIDKDKILMTKK